MSTISTSWSYTTSPEPKRVKTDPKGEGICYTQARAVEDDLAWDDFSDSGESVRAEDFLPGEGVVAGGAGGGIEIGTVPPKNK